MLENCNQPPEIINFLKEYAKKPTGFLLLAGKNGTGKTFAAKSVMSNAYVQQFDKKIYSQSELNLRWQKEIFEWKNVFDLFDKLVEPQLLILDDIGTRTPTEAFMDFLYAIIDKRYCEKEKKGTIITTNLNYKDMREKFGDAFVSRVASGKVFRFDGEDRRFKEF
jgi:DNA replication protein DnaC